MSFKFYAALFSMIIPVLLVSSCKSEQKDTVELAPVEMDTAAVSIFDGTSFEGWKQYNSDSIGPKWTIEDGAIVASADGEIDNTGFGHSLITVKEYGNFELTLDYKIAKGGNSGIMYHAKEDTAYGEDYVTGPEFQLLDDEFSKTETLPIKMAASLYDMYIPAETKKLKPHTEWNSIKLVYNNGHVEHWLNGEKVLEYEEGTDDYKARKAVSKWKDSEVWGSFKEGHIGLQDHGDAIRFRNIMIKEL